MSKSRHTTVDCVEHIYKLQDRNDELQSVLVYAINALDAEFYAEIQDKNTIVGSIRHRIDQVLNYGRYSD